MDPERDECLCALSDATVAFRLGMDGRANEMLVRFIDLLASFLSRAEKAEAVATLGPLLSEVVAAQRRGDALRIADLLEYRLLPCLS